MITIRQGTIPEVISISNQIPEFNNPYQAEDYESKFWGDHLILIAEKDNKLMGFKCGYHRDTETRKFYSWMGGVLPEYRESGVASMLLAEMEDWCRQHNFKILEFKTLNEHKKMLFFGIKHGFEIVDVVDSTKDPRKRIILQKTLN